MRAKVGDELILFDGQGGEFPARIAKIGRSEIELSVIERRNISRELPFRLVVGAALPKGDRQRWLVEKLVELGVSELVPLVTERSVAQPSGNTLERLRRAVIEASKQCGRNQLMAVGHATTFNSFLAEATESATKLIAHPPTPDEGATSWSTNAGAAIIAVGPEGGFTEEEIALANDHYWTNVSLGTRVLRTETAAVALASVIALQYKSSE